MSTRWESLTGRVIGRCRIAEQIGEGGMGAVFRATHEALKIPVAVKFLRMEDEVPGAESTQRFLREAQLAATLRHPNIVRIYDVNSEGLLHYIIMELLPGTSLAAILHAEGALSVSTACGYAAQIADALAHAHARGVIHRDIKPDNVMVAADGTAVLTDFGIAAPEGVSRLTQAGLVVGTAWYLAPEQARGVKVDSRADLYALGVMLYEMLTGHLPFDGDSAMQQIAARVTRDPIPIARWRKDLPDDLVALVGRLLARSPEQRVQRADEVLAALRPAEDRTTAVAAAAPERRSAPMPPAVTARTAELLGLSASAGVPMDPLTASDLIDLRVSDVLAALKHAEGLSDACPQWFMVHRDGVADILGLSRRAVALSMRVTRGIAAKVGVREVLGEAMKRPNGAIAVRATDDDAVLVMRSWLEGARVLGPLPTEILRPAGLFVRFLRGRISGVLAVTDRQQTTLARFDHGSLAAMHCPSGHALEIGELTQHDLGEWMNTLSPEAQVTFSLRVVDGPGATLHHDAMQSAVLASCEALAVLSAEARREFGASSAAVFSAHIREASSRVREVFPLSAITAGTHPVDPKALWEALKSGSHAAREVLTVDAIEAMLTAGSRAAAETLQGRKLARARQSAMLVLSQARGAFEALGCADVLQRAFG